MRIISGIYKGRRINPPKKLPVRPTTDRAKEGLFNILQNNFELDTISVLDLFSGTGSISFEFASHGAKEILAIDINSRCTKSITNTIEKLQIKQIEVIRGNIFHIINNLVGPFDIIFADPPYDLELLETLPDKILESKLLAKDGWLILEHDNQHSFLDHPAFNQERQYGKVQFSIFSVE